MRRLRNWIEEMRRNAGEIRYAKKEAKRGYLSQMSDILRLRLGRTRLGIAEYYYFRLYDGKFSPGASKKNFLGWRMEEEIDRQMNSREWWSVANDKLIFYSLMEGLALPYPRVKAIYCRGERYFPGAALLADKGAVGDYLRCEGNYPLFLKPVDASYGRGAMAFLRYDRSRDEIHLACGKSEKADALTVSILSPREKGYILTEMLAPHPDLEKVCGPRLSSVRVIVLLERGIPRIFRAVWKITTGNNITDNFAHGKNGNLLGWVDVNNGRIEQAVGGIGSSLGVMNTHPDTKAALAGITLPCWSELKAIVSRGGSAYPGLTMQHWDIALARGGPVVLELNVEGGLDIHQLARLRGFYDEEFEDYLKFIRGSTKHSC